MKIEAHVKKMEGDVDNLTKRINNINTSLEKAVVTLKQVKTIITVTTYDKIS
jgi:hypothetical protein